MKPVYSYTTVWLMLSINCFSAEKKSHDPDLTYKAEELISQHGQLHFLENKGQMVNTDNIPLPFVLFKTSGLGMDVYITENGLTYVFVKAEEEQSSSIKPFLSKAEGLCVTQERMNGGHEEENIKIEMAWVNMHLKDGSIKKENIIKEGESAEHFNYFYPHCPDGIYDVKQYEKITIQDVYPGIDWVFYNSSKTGMKYDFIVHPGADPAQIKLIYESENPLTIDRSGNINIPTPLGTLTENAPYSYVKETKAKVKSYFKKTIIDKHNVEISFQLETLNSKYKTLIIDPQLVWATYYSGDRTDGFTSAATDANGNLFITGYSGSTNFPVQSSIGSYYQGSTTSSEDVIILKFNNMGVRLWATFYGGSGNMNDLACFITTDVAGNVWVTGQTVNPNFPVQSSFGAYNQLGHGGGTKDAFILKFNNSGTRLWATFYGGFGVDEGYSITTDAVGNIFVTGYTASPNFPVQSNVGSYNQVVPGDALRDAFILKFNNAGGLLWATWYGGSDLDEGRSVTTDVWGNVFVTGYTSSTNFLVQNGGAGTYNQLGYGGGNRDAFILKFNNTGTLLWATFYGGKGLDEGNCIATDAAGNVFVTGMTGSANFPVQSSIGAYNQFYAGNSDAFILKFNNAGQRQWATFYGGSKFETFSQVYMDTDNLAIDLCGNVYVAIQTFSTNFTFQNFCPANYFDNTLGGLYDVLITCFSNSGTLLWNSYMGGAGGDHRQGLAVDGNNNLFMAGEWVGGVGYPVVNPGGGAYYNPNPGQSDDGCIVKFIPSPVTLTTQSTNNTSGCSCNATATASLTCGLPLYNYTWSNGNQTLNSNSNTNTISNLCPGTYTVTATSTCFSVLTASVIITGTTGGLSTSVSQNNINCNGKSTGTATVNANGGTGPYTYLWSPVSQTSSTATGLAAGTYSASITDASGCTSTQIVTITQPPAIVLGFSTQWSCTVNSGTSTINVANGSSPYTYLWSTGQTAQTVTGLAQGSYNATVTDSKGCTQTQAVSIAKPPPMTLVASSVATTCGNTNGRANVAVNGNSGLVTYSWAPGGQTGATIVNLAAGTYTVLVSDYYGCSQTATAVVPSSPGNNASFVQSPTGTVCIGTMVSFTNTGTPPGAGITYNWVISPITPANVSGTTTNFSYTFLTAGTYNIQHTVAGNGCNTIVNSTVTVINCSTGPSVTATGSSVCPGTCATVNSSGAGGTTPYTYAWSNGATTQNISPCPVSTTTYTVTIRDAGGNTSTSTAVVTIYPPVTVTTTATNITCSGASTGSATATGVGGNPGYTFAWSNGGTTSQISN
ncbi:MAG: SBBP repeat-containing protein, partial [Bacteroidetes bacterium]|nr:SBBP repeat-containing protein [Bacteroidota bacterium]